MQSDRMIQYLSRFVRVQGWEQTHWLSKLGLREWTDEQGPAWRLGRIQRALGMIEVLATSEQLARGVVSYGDQEYALTMEGPSIQDEALAPDTIHHVSIWPTMDAPYRGSQVDASAWRLDTLVVSHVRPDLPHPHRVEVVGMLNHVWIGGFELALWVQSQRQLKYVRFVGDYPWLNDLGSYVYIIAALDPATGQLMFVSRHELTFVRPTAAWYERRAQRQAAAPGEPRRRRRSRRGGAATAAAPATWTGSSGEEAHAAASPEVEAQRAPAPDGAQGSQPANKRPRRRRGGRGRRSQPRVAGDASSSPQSAATTPSDLGPEQP